MTINMNHRGFFKHLFSASFYLVTIFMLGIATAAAQPVPTRSTSIALTANGRLLVSVNTVSNSVAIFRVRAGGDLTKADEVPVGRDPRCVAIFRNGEAFVTNSASGTVSVISLRGNRFEVVEEISVGTEPRGCALTPNGTQLYVANHTDGTASVIDTASRTVVNTVQLSANPTAIAISNDGDGQDNDETVFVTRFFAELIPAGPGEGFDDGKQGVVYAFPVNNPAMITKITLSPLANAGFTADRTLFCPAGNANLHSDIFCPDVNAVITDPVITQDPQGAYPNQLASAILRGGKLYLPNIGAAPEPPVVFNVNVQALVHVVDAQALTEQTALHVNLNNQIKTEAQPGNPTESLDRLFGNDLVAMDCNAAGTDCLIVSRGGNYVIRANIQPNGSLDIGAPANVVRFQTGNIPTGVVIDSQGKRAYVNNEVNLSVSILDLQNNSVSDQDVPAGTPPAPGSFAHRALIGKLVFFTALGTPDNGLTNTPIRDINPLESRGKASDNGWSGCASCHNDGLSDGATWIFPTGPRQTIPLDAFYSRSAPAHDQRISNWSALRGSVTDFNNNSRNIQGGLGFAGDPPNPNIYNHGITQGASEALDFETTWVQTIRPLNQPAGDEAMVIAGRAVFEANCASCHGGSKWTKSQVFHKDNPAFDSNPLAGGSPIDPGIANAGPQIISYTSTGGTITFLEDIGTFDPADPLEIRGAGATGITALGALGFNAPALLDTAYHEPFFHNGAAQTLEEVFPLHDLNGGTIETTLNATDRANLAEFLRSIDAGTAPLRSEADDFRELF